MQTKKRIISIKREIDSSDKKLIMFLERNMWYRRYLYNKGVEYVKNNNDRLSKGGAYALGTYLYHAEQENDILYDSYARGIRPIVCRDIAQAVDAVWRSRKGTDWRGVKNPNADIHFRTYNPCDGSFKVENKRSGKVKKMCYITTQFSLYYKANGVKNRNGKHIFHFNISLKEPIYYDMDDDGYMYDKHKRYRFLNEDIKEVAFLKKNKKYYIIIVCEVTINPCNGKTHKRKKSAGIDLGIRNPITLCNGEEIIQYRMSKKILRKLEYLERRAERLQSIMDTKAFCNIRNGKSPYSKNYEKVRRKFRRTWEKIYNIRHDWHYKTAYMIVNSYDTIVVDEFRQPVAVDLGAKVEAKLNHDNRLHGMFLFTRILGYMADKYNCNYIKSCPNTTRTCYKCGHINPGLSLKQKNLKCEKCGEKIDRDKNAAINCYKHSLEMC